MANDKSLREHLLELLKGGGAHIDFDTAVKNMPFNLQGKTPNSAEHSPWAVLEHLRIAQWDILEFIRNPKHVSPKFPVGYWPSSEAPPNEKAWDQSAEAFRADLRGLEELVTNKTTDLLAPIPHADGKTVLREVLLAVDHNAYHLGQLVLLRRMLGAWQ